MATQIIYWDACVFIEYGKGDAGTAGRIAPIREVVRKVHEGKVALITSALTYTEILPSSMKPGIAEEIESFLQNSDCVNTVAISIPIAQKAQTIRDQFFQSKIRNDKKKFPVEEIDPKTIKPKTPDIIHIATAMMFKAEELHTYDKDMISMSEKEVVGGMPIQKP